MHDYGSGSWVAKFLNCMTDYVERSRVLCMVYSIHSSKSFVQNTNRDHIQ